MNIHERTLKLQDRAANRSAQLGCPNRRAMVVRNLGIQGGSSVSYLPVVTDTTISPVPTVTTVKPSLVGLEVGGGSGNGSNAGITISSTDFQAEVSRSISRTVFVPKDLSRVLVWIDAEYDGEELKGIECRVIHVDDRDPCKWEILLRRLRD